MKKHLTLFMLLPLFLISCAGRLPSPQKAEHLLKKHFKSYAKKYPDSVFGQHRVEKVTIEGAEEIQKNLAQTATLVQLEDGSKIPVQAVFLYKAPLGWRLQGWERKDATPLPGLGQ